MSDAYSSDLAGVQDAARELGDAREARDAAIAADAPRELTEEERDARDANAGGRELYRERIARAVESNLGDEGRKFNARSAAGTLAALRQFEAQQDAVRGQAPLADALPGVTQARTQAEPAQAGTEPAQDAQAAAARAHPAVQEAMTRLAHHEQMMTQAQAQYQAGLTQVLALAHQSAMREFADIRTEADVLRLQATDPARFQRFHQTAQTLVAAQAEINNNLQRQSAQRQQQFRLYADQQDFEFNERHPELKDPVRSAAAARDAVSALVATGISERELSQSWASNPLLRDARVQSFLYEAGKLFAARDSVRRGEFRKNPVRQVQRPGAAQPRTDTTEFDRLNEKLGADLNVKNAGLLLAARRRSR